jgi:thioredoxin reductase (NADPH)
VTVEAERLAETPDTSGAFPRLTEPQIEALQKQGERRPVQPGDVLFRQGDRDYDFFVVLEGKVAVVEEQGDQERPIAVHGPGRFLGELGMLTGQAAFTTAVMRTPGEVLAVPLERVRALVADDPRLGDLILRALLIRRSLLIGLATGLKIVGSRYSPDTRRLRDWCARSRLPHTWIDPDSDADTETLLRQLHVAPEETPIVVWRGERVLRNPSNAELAELIGMRSATSATAVCDLLVVGAGPAGLAASVYGASDGLSTIALDAVAPGGQASTSSQIENYLGFPSGVSGPELAERAALQARKFGARISAPAEAVALTRHDDHFAVALDDGSAVEGRAVVIATGARYRKLDVPGIDRLESASVYYAATEMEARACAGDTVAVVGGGNSAAQAALFLARPAGSVRLLIAHGDLGRDMSRYLADRIERSAGIEVMLNTEVRELIGEETLEALAIEDNRTAERGTVEARALFVFIGVRPHTRWLSDIVALTERGFVLTGRDLVREAGLAASSEHYGEPLLLETSVPGVFAAGDARSGSTKRVASAVGEGAMAVRAIHERLGHAAA